MSKYIKKSKSGSGKLGVKDILGQARSTLDSSRQFRDRDPVIPNKTGNKSSSARQNLQSQIISAKGLNQRIPLRKPGIRALGNNYLAQSLEDVQVTNEKVILPPEPTLSGILISNKASGYQSDLGSSSDDGNDNIPSSDSDGDDSNSSDSTITPPTITDTHGSISEKYDKSRKSISSVHKTSLKAIKYDTSAQKDDKGEDISKNLFEKTILIRGDPISNESYAVIKAMSKGKEERAISPAKAKKFQYDYSYTEDFVSESKLLSNSNSLEVPNTESEDIEIPEEELSHLSSYKINQSETKSYSLVDEIVENLQDLKVSEKQNPGDEDYDLLEPFPTLLEQMALGDLDDLAKEEENTQSQLDEADIISLMEKTSILTSKVSSSFGTDKPRSVSYNNPSHSRSLKPNSSKSISHNKSSGSIIGISRRSQTKNFQLALSLIKLDEDKVVDQSYSPPNSKAQLHIHHILKKEVYLKEVKRLRDINKQEEKLLKKLNLVRADNMTKVKESDQVFYPEPNYSKALIQDLTKDPNAQQQGPSTRNFEAPYFNDGSLGTPVPYSNENWPRTPDENYKNEVNTMDVRQLIKEVVASNERMYRMTISAANQMGKEYGKDAKLLMKIKRKRELRQKK